MNISESVDKYLESEYPGLTTSIYRDLSLNFKKLLEDGPLEPNERFMSLLSVSVSLENKPMSKLAVSLLKENSIPEEQIREAAEVAGIMGMNNVYYKFRGYLDPTTRENYSRAGLRMQSLMKPVTGKSNFEMMSMAVSVVNGCPTCITSHEKALVEIGIGTDKIHELAKLAAVCKGLSSLKKAQEIL